MFSDSEIRNWPVYREGYRDGKSLIAEIGDIRLVRLAVPPAMPETYQTGFIKACDDATRRQRPNKNYILQVMRDGDFDDPWGLAMSWAFACAENLAAFGQQVPSELGYQMSIAGPCVESYEDFEVAEFLGADVDHENETVDFDVDVTNFASKVKEVQFAARCLARYLDWCKAAGRDY